MKSIFVIQTESSENLYQCCDNLALNVIHCPPNNLEIEKNIFFDFQII